MRIIFYLCFQLTILSVFGKSLQKIDNDYGDPLFLTPYIESGDILAGQKAALVEPFFENIISYSGFFTVDKEYNSNMFMWFFPAEIDSKNAPVLLWLQGGPGTSSIYGQFTQVGPYYIDNNKKIAKKQYYWTKKLNVLFLDNPIGAGFSFTDNQDGYATNEEMVAVTAHNGLEQFFKLFPDYRKNDFYINGESYGGKFAASIGYEIHENNKFANDPNEIINLKGIAFSNGYCDPLHMLNYSEYLYQIGMVDIHGRQELEVVQNRVIDAINRNDTEQILLNILDIALLYINLTGNANVYNFMKDGFTEDDLYDNVGKLIEQPIFRKNIHVSNLTIEDGMKVKILLLIDFMVSVKPKIEILIENYKLLFYNGQLDVIAAYPLTVNVLQSLEWSGAEEYKIAKREIWKVDGKVTGYMKSAKNLKEVLVRDAGHLVPEDQPKWAYNLISNFTNTL